MSQICTVSIVRCMCERGPILFVRLEDKYHQALFPEEYDHCYDSPADAADRKKGISPMSEAYTSRVNSRRRDLGFAGIDEYSMRQTDTLQWVKRMISEDKTLELDNLINRFGLEPLGSPKSE